MRLVLLTAAAFAIPAIDWKGLLAAVVAGVVAGVFNWLTSQKKPPPSPPPAAGQSGP